MISLRFSLARIVCRVLGAVGRKLGKGTASPGEYALKICPDALKSIRVRGKIIAVTGSNGKTTTSNLIAHILTQNNKSVINNAIGSNLTGGVATLLLCNCNGDGYIDKDFVVLEVDERFSRLIFRDFSPDYFLVLNLLRDQVVRNGNSDLVMAKINEAVKPSVKMILNANDPISMNIAPDNERIYFEMDKTSRSTPVCISGCNECRVCPKCFSRLEYDFYHYDHLGKFRCTKCDFSSPEAKYIGKDIDFEKRTVSICGKTVHMNWNTTFNVFNTIAAIAVCVEAGISLEEAVEAVSSFNVSKERFDTFDVAGHKCTLLMTKQNAGSIDQSISYVLEQTGKKTAVVFVNDVLYLGYKDISWLYDVSFNRLVGKVDKIICTGTRAYDAAVCLKNSGYPENDIIIERDLRKINEAFSQAVGDIYLMAASAFGNEDAILNSLKV